MGSFWNNGNYIEPHGSIKFIQNIPTNATVYKNVIIPYLYEAQHILVDTPPIIRSLNCTSSLWFCMRGRLFGRVVAGRYQRLSSV
jgi:hypothetical protein